VTKDFINSEMVGKLAIVRHQDHGHSVVPVHSIGFHAWQSHGYSYEYANSGEPVLILDVIDQGGRQAYMVLFITKPSYLTTSIYYVRPVHIKDFKNA